MEPAAPRTEVSTPRITAGVAVVQAILGCLLYLLLVLPFLRRAHGRERLNPKVPQLLVINHVSLLDTLLIAGLCWWRHCYPLLVLGDRNVWHASGIRKFLSRRTAFLLDRGKLNPNRIRELQAFGRAGNEFQLIVFPEGTRGDGVNVATCQPGIYFIAQAAQIPILPVFIENMQLVSTKTGPFQPLRGFRKVEVHFGEPIAPETYLPMEREAFVEFIRQKIAGARLTP
ncbi:MAG: lysophospholipid acyltransferase family protein [Verrucomicrobiota bacterium]